MKKILMITAQFIFVASSAFAATPIVEGGKVIVPNGQQGAGTIIASMSKGVLGSILAGGSEYAVLLKHIYGSREYASASSGVKIYFNDVAPADKNTPNMSLTLTSSSSDDFATWTMF